MSTIRLYDRNPDIRTFQAVVLSCEPKGDRYEAVLDQTAFFPEGGGQMADRGEINGIPVIDVKERQGEIRHLLGEAIPVGEIVTGCVDPDHRLDMMQQHSGEHIFSGLVCSTFHCDNVGFHIGPEELTIDFNKPLRPEDVKGIEQRANAVIWRNTPIHAWYPDPEELKQMEYRSKKELTGDVRIVSIEGADVCACCGTHVAFAGQVGQIKVVDCRNYKSGVRITLKCGKRALMESEARILECREISHLTNGKWGCLTEAVNRLMAERDELKAERDRLAGRLCETAAAAETGFARVIHGQGLPAAQLRKTAGTIAPDAGITLVLTEREDGWNFAMYAAQLDVRIPAGTLTERFGGKAGGPRDLVQGVLTGGSVEKIRTFLKELYPDT